MLVSVYKNSLRAVTIESLLISGCGLSHDSVEDSCKGS